ncbi:hypothetical protein [Streptomyces sp. NPDC059278]|uniref:hypothetical protein n=1 Tax=Streptomyces sp. NPDC059278 TaxID=3346801 RepID=UPI0036950D3C
MSTTETVVVVVLCTVVAPAASLIRAPADGSAEGLRVAGSSSPAGGCASYAPGVPVPPG